MNIWSLLLVVVGGLIGLVSSLITAMATERAQSKRLEQEHKHQLELAARDYQQASVVQRRERLRDVYEIILNAALEFQSGLAQMQYIMEDETLEARDKRLGASLAVALKPVDAALVKLLLEDYDGSQRDIKAALEQIRSTFYSHARKSRANRDYSVLGYIPFMDVDQDLGKMEELVAQLQLLMHQQLQQLSEVSPEVSPEVSQSRAIGPAMPLDPPALAPSAKKRLRQLLGGFSLHAR